MTGGATGERIPLPVDPVLPDVVAALSRDPVLVLSAPPGSGKTTRVPPAILEAGLAGGGDVWVAQPRRLAARMAARRVAAERGEAPGGTVGYQVRFEQAGGPGTRLWYVTEGVLVRRLLADPGLPGVGAVVLDEFHERSLDADLALALLRRLRARDRPDLRLVLMSATMDCAALADALGARVLQAEGRRFEVWIEHAGRLDPRPLPVRVAEAVARLGGADRGDLLVFLPGAVEIRRAAEACAGWALAAGREVLPLHGDLPPGDQDRAVLPGPRPKVILATNVAETSITVEGVGGVVDSGLARRLVHSPWSGLPSLRVVPVSKASAAQRAGRAGRTRPGTCVRLYTQIDFEGRPDAEAPEILRADLADATLLLRAAGLDPAAGVPWLDPPPRPALDAADALLRRLGLVSPGGSVTGAGRLAAGLPAHPRLGALVLEAAGRGRLSEGCLLAALLGDRDVRRATGARRMLSGEAPVEGFLDPVEVAGSLASGERDPAFDPGVVARVRRAASQMEGLARREGLGTGVPSGDPARALRLALLAGFPDRVGRARRASAPGLARSGAMELAMSAGGTADLPADALLPEGRLVIAVDASERPADRGRALSVRSACALDEDDLLEGRMDEVVETTEVRFLSGGDRVEAVRRLAYDRLVLEERAFDAGPEALAAALAEGLAGRDPASLGSDREEVLRFLARVEWLRSQRPGIGLPPFDDARAGEVRREACRGCRTLAEVRRRPLVPLLTAVLSGPQRRALEALAPSAFRLPGGRTLRIEYDPGRPPWAASRLQDFFGLATGPSVLDGAQPVVLHLLSPAGRDVQVTTDLAGFWQRHYPALARELRRRYPRHKWPDDPARAAPPPPNRAR